MTPRAIILGLLLTLLIAASSYYITEYAGATSLTAHHFPPIVVAATLLLAVAVNPLLNRVGWRPMSMAELMVFAAIGLAGSAWSRGTIAGFTNIVAGPNIQRPLKPNWDAVNTFAYLPGGSAELATGYLPDPEALGARLRASIADAPDDPLHAFATRLGPITTQLLLGQSTDRVSLNSGDRTQLVRGLNRALASSDLPDDPALRGVAWPDEVRAMLDRRANAPLEPHEVMALNRAMLVALAPDLVRPAPRGEGVLLLGGRADPEVTEPLRTGTEGDQRVGLLDLPWSAWWPVLRLWGGVVLLVGIASLALVVIVHRQWSQHELLPYPIARFFQEVTARSGDRVLPDVMRSRLFWLAMALFLFWGVSYGLHLWFDQLPAMPRKLDFTAVAQVMPNASRIYGFQHFFNPVLFPVIIGFAFFIDERVSLSMGLSVLIWIALGAVLMDWGIAMNTNRYDIGKSGPAIRFGACLGMTIVILYLGRRYYGSLLKRSVGLGRRGGAAPEGVVAVWTAAICSAGATWLLVHYGGMSTLMALLLVGLSLMLVMVMARVNVETGLFMCPPEWIPWVMVGGFLGGSGIGTESLIVMALGGLMLVGSPRDALAPYLINALRLTGTAKQGVRPARIAPLLGAAVLIVFVVGLSTTLLLQYNRGTPPGEILRSTAPAVSMGSFSAVLYDLNAENAAPAATGVTGWAHLTQARPNTVTVVWTCIGLAAVLICLFGRIHLPWWPLHPVAFIVMGTYAANATAFSFLLGFAIRKVIVWLGGKRAFDKAKPFMVGMIAADVLATVGWAVAGLIYYLHTGTSPTEIQLMP